MKTMFLAFVATALIAVVAYYGLHEAGYSAQERTASTSVRLDS